MIAVAATAAVVLPLMFSSAPFLLAGVLVLGLAFWQWETLLYIAVFLLPVAPIVQTDFPIHDLVSLLRILIFVGVFLRKLLEHGSLGKWLFGSTLDKLALLYLAIATVSVLINPDAGSGIRALFRLISYLSLYYTVTAWVQSRAQLFKLMKVLLVSTMLICILGFYQFAANGYGQWFYWLYRGQEDYIEPFAGRITSVFLHVNPFAAFLNLVLPLALAMRVKSPDPSAARLGGLCFFMGMLTLFLTQSRGALLAFVFMLWLAYRYVVKDRGTRKKVLLQVVAALVITVVAYRVRDGLTEPQGPASDSSASDTQTTFDRFTGLNEATLTRLVIYGKAWSFFVSSPIIGVGYGNFPRLFGPSIEGGPDNVWDTHSLYLKLLSETGILGAVCYLGLVVVVCRWARSGLARTEVATDRIVFFGVLGATVTMILHGFVDVMLDVPQFAALLWLLFAALPLMHGFEQKDVAP
jgi:putative inorganic carbon (HCO3(-)) transporter